jgi:hypothetical protein
MLVKEEEEEERKTKERKKKSFATFFFSFFFCLWVLRSSFLEVSFTIVIFVCIGARTHSFIVRQQLSSLFSPSVLKLSF